MTEWTTIRVRKDARDEAAARKPEDMSWSEWITDEERGPTDVDELADAVADRVAAQIDD